MKSICKYLLALLPVAATLVSCNETLEPQTKQEAITINIFGEDETPETKSSLNPKLQLYSGSVAFYQNGQKFTESSWSGGTNKVVITDIPSSKCNVYAVGNSTISWPTSESSLTSTYMPVDISSSYIPEAVNSPSTWSVGTSTMDIHLARLYTRVDVSVKRPDGSATVVSGKVLNPTTKITPFGSSYQKKDGTGDTASSADIGNLTSGKEASLYIPSNGPSTVQVTTNNRKGNDGVNYDETYTFEIGAKEAVRGGYVGKEATINGITETGGQVVVVIGSTDTRSFTFSPSSMTVTGNNTDVSGGVKGTAGNGKTGWTYTLSWTGNSALGNTTTITLGGVTKSLGTSGSFTGIAPSDENKKFNIKSTYKGTDNVAVNLTASVANKSATCAVTVKPGKKPISLDLDQPSIKILPYVVVKLKYTGTVTYNDGTSKSVTVDKPFTIGDTRLIQYEPAYSFNGSQLWGANEAVKGYATGSTTLTGSYTEDGVTVTDVVAVNIVSSWTDIFSAQLERISISDAGNNSLASSYNSMTAFPKKVSIDTQMNSSKTGTVKLGWWFKNTTACDLFFNTKDLVNLWSIENGTQGLQMGSTGKCYINAAICTAYSSHSGWSGTKTSSFTEFMPTLAWADNYIQIGGGGTLYVCSVYPMLWCIRNNTWYTPGSSYSTSFEPEFRLYLEDTVVDKKSISIKITD